jgi:WD40 repeat protein
MPTRLLSTVLVSLLGAAAAAAEPKPVVIPAMKHDGPNAQAVAFSPDGKFVAAGFPGATNGRFPLAPAGEGGVGVWETATGKPVWFRPEFGDVAKVEFSRDGGHLGYARVYGIGSYGSVDAVVVLDARTGEERHRWTDRWVFAMSRSADEVFAGAEAFALKGFARAGALGGPDPEFLAPTADGKTLGVLYRVKVPTGNGPAYRTLMYGLAAYTGDQWQNARVVESDRVVDSIAAAASPDGKALVTGNHGGTARVWAGDQLAEVKELTTPAAGHLLPLFSPDGKTLALAQQQTRGEAWKYGKGRNEDDAPDVGAGRSGCEVRFYETAGWKETARWQFADSAFPTFSTRLVRTTRTAPEDNPPRFAFSPDGKHLLAGCNGLVLVDAATGKVVRQYAVKK